MSYKEEADPSQTMNMSYLVNNGQVKIIDKGDINSQTLAYQSFAHSNATQYESENIIKQLEQQRNKSIQVDDDYINKTSVVKTDQKKELRSRTITLEYDQDDSLK